MVVPSNMSTTIFHPLTYVLFGYFCLYPETFSVHILWESVEKSSLVAVVEILSGLRGRCVHPNRAPLCASSGRKKLTHSSATCNATCNALSTNPSYFFPCTFVHHSLGLHSQSWATWSCSHTSWGLPASKVQIVCGNKVGCSKFSFQKQCYVKSKLSETNTHCVLKGSSPNWISKGCRKVCLKLMMSRAKT